MQNGAKQDNTAASPPEVTLLLRRIAAGESAAADALLPILYEDLRAIAGGQFRGQAGDHTLQPTALVHEAYLRLVRTPASGFQDRAHFMAVAATAMRNILRDHARAKAAAKRKPTGKRIDPTFVATPNEERPIDAVDLDEALSRLEEADARMARIVDLWFFGGLTTDEIGELMDISGRTVKRIWRQARAWLNAELAGDTQR